MVDSTPLSDGFSARRQLALAYAYGREAAGYFPGNHKSANPLTPDQARKIISSPKFVDLSFGRTVEYDDLCDEYARGFNSVMDEMKGVAK